MNSKMRFFIASMLYSGMLLSPYAFLAVYISATTRFNSASTRSASVLFLTSVVCTMDVKVSTMYHKPNIMCC